MCGQKWLDEYSEMLDTHDKRMVTVHSTNNCFRFGDGKAMKADKKVSIPGYIGKERIVIDTDVVEADIPLLLSKANMKTMGMRIDFAEDTMSWRNGDISGLRVTSTGHYAVPINKSENFRDDKSYIKHVFYNCDTNEVRRKALKLHKQFAHPKAEKLIRLIKEAGIKDDKLEEEVRKIDETCETCVKYQRSPPRPIVSMPMARNFNDVVSMDLKTWGSKYFLVMVDLATRYCSACVISSKSPSVIIDGVMRYWVAMLGTPKKILTDNGGEFNNDEFRSMGENFNIDVMCTAAESPWSNGTCERLNAVLKANVLKIREDTNCNLDTALAWAVAARNAIHNNSGFSPNQLVFSFNPNHPNIAEDSPAALEGVTSSQVVADNLNALRKSREEFVKADADERIRRALSGNIRKTVDTDIKLGSYVYYKREGCDQWRGPARVIGKDGKVNLLRHGGNVVRAHICRVKGCQDREVDNAKGQKENENRIEVVQNAKSEEKSTGIMIDDSDEDDTEEESVEECDRVPQEHQEVGNVIPRVGRRYEVSLKDTNERMNIKVLSRAGKSSGKYRNCFNYRNEENGDESWIDFELDVTEMREIEDEEVMITYSDEKVMEAKRKELKSWIDNGVFEEVEWEGQDTISTRWIVTEKANKEGTRIKARLVARGFEEELQSDVTTESPTCGKEALRLALAAIQMKGWICHTIDIKSAFLQGGEIKRDVYLYPPKEFSRGKIWRLKKIVYGLNDAARMWYETVKEELIKCGLRMSRFDPAMFTYSKDDTLQGIVCIHVDDFCWGGTDVFEHSVISKVRNSFLVGSVDSKHFKYVGLNIQQTANGIIIDQENYIKSVRQVDISHKRTLVKDAYLGEEEVHKYRSVVGQLNWIGTQTRPDISFDVCSLSTLFNKCTVGDMMDANKVIKRVKTNQVHLYFPVLQKPLHLQCFSDASFANLSDLGSQCGYIIFLADNYGSRCPILWKSRKIRRIVKSTLAAETMALLEAAESAYYIGKMIEDIGIASEVPVMCYVDNRSLVDALRSVKKVDDKYLRINIACLKDMLERGDIKDVKWVDTKSQLANCLTKKGASPQGLLEAVSM